MFLCYRVELMAAWRKGRRRKVRVKEDLLDNLGSERQIIAMFLLQMIFKIRPLINEYVGSRWHL